MKRAIFLDRDGVIVEDVGYHHKIKDFKLLPNAIEGLKLLKNYELFTVTNQSGIGRGYFTIKDFQNFNDLLIQKLKKQDIKIKKTYVCPHAPDENCICRKPSPKLIKDAAKEYCIDLAKSFMIGDRKKDIDMGKNAGCGTILVLTGRGMKEKEHANPNYIAKDLLDAAKWVIKTKKNRI